MASWRAGGTRAPRAPAESGEPGAESDPKDARTPAFGEFGFGFGVVEEGRGLWPSGVSSHFPSLGVARSSCASVLRGCTVQVLCFKTVVPPQFCSLRNA
jgi:hypothetical protein